MKTRVQITLILCSLIVFSNCGGQSNKTDSTYMIEEILKIEDPTNAIIELDTKLNEISDYGNNINVLSDAEKVVLFVENLEREVNNGGFNQFFFNSSGDFANETLEALKLIGANKTAEIVIRAYNEWPNTNIPSERLERQNILEEIEDKAEETWNNCDTQFYEYNDDISSLLLIYVKANKNEFK
ncbi:MAG: DMP19 family protein [Bacteroidetes bacterium]|nr:DMP19 family protein [Bacteroidota bacterium]